MHINPIKIMFQKCNLFCKSHINRRHLQNVRPQRKILMFLNKNKTKKSKIISTHIFCLLHVGTIIINKWVNLCLTFFEKFGVEFCPQRTSATCTSATVISHQPFLWPKLEKVAQTFIIMMTIFKTLKMWKKNKKKY